MFKLFLFIIITPIICLVIWKKLWNFSNLKSFFSDSNSNKIPDGFDEISDEVNEIKDEITFRVERIKEEVNDVKDSITEVVSQIDDIGDAAKGKKRRGRKPKNS